MPAPHGVDGGSNSASAASAAEVDRACAQLRETLRRHGLRCTPHRLAIVALLAGQPRPGHLAAGEIRVVLAEAGHHLDNATVYRALAMLVDVAMVHTTTTADGATSYGLAGVAHHHVVCTRCGQVCEVAAEPHEKLVERAAHASHYHLEHSAVLHGTCPTCQDLAHATS